MGVHKKGGLVGGFDQLRAPDAPTISVAAGNESVVVTITNPSDVGGGDITSYAVSALTGPIEDTTFAVTVVSDSGNKYAIDGTTQGSVTLHKGHTYIFDQSDSSNSSHPLRLSTTSNGSHGGGSEYTTGVTTSGTPGSAGAFTKIVVDSGAASTLYYYCSSHSNMGGTANVKTSLQGSASGSSSPVTVSSLTDDETYNVRASAINVFGQSPYSAASSISPFQAFGGGTAGLFYGGEQQLVHGITIASTGNAEDFGDPHSNNVYYCGSAASSTRAVFIGGANGQVWNIMEYYTFTSKGNGTDFGDMSVAAYGMNNGLISNSTRGVYQFGRQYSGGYSYVNVTEYITIASPGNATDFGDMDSSITHGAGCCSPTRGIVTGGLLSSNTSRSQDIHYITIASAGNSSTFGYLQQARWLFTGASSNTRGLVFGGRTASYMDNGINDISYITISSTGNTSDFGDLTAASRFNAALSSSTRAVCALGSASGSNVNTLDYVTISSAGNATDFGDLTSHFNGGVGASQVHGGLS